MAFTAKDVQALREISGAGMMDCKNALKETDGNMEKAIEFLRERGLAVAAKKAGRVAAEGSIYSYVSDGVGVIVEVNCETDFAAKSDKFIQFIQDVAVVIAKQNPADVDALLTSPFSDGLTVADALRDRVLVIGENLKIRRFVRYDTGLSVAYVHMGGKIGVLVNLKVSDNLAGNAAVTELGRDIAMQVAAMRPQWLKPEDVDPEVLETEKAIMLSQTLNEGKPQNIAEKIVAGRINKYYEEVCLLKQAFVKENKVSVAQYVQNKAKELGGAIEVVKFTRYEKGEGLAKREDNFADEVASMIK